MTFKPLVVALSLATLSFGFVAASASTAGAGGVWKAPKMNPIPAAVKELPAAYKKSGVLKIADVSDFPPCCYFAPGTHTETGTDYNIGVLLAESLGLKLILSTPTFDSIIPGIQAGRYDISVDSMGPTLARQKVINFVTYSQAGLALAVPKGNPKNLTENNLCGQLVGTVTGSYESTVTLPALNTACTAAGQPAITVSLYPTTPDVSLALLSGRIDAICFDQTGLDVLVKQTPGIEISATWGLGIQGIGISKKSGLTPAIYTAMKTILKSNQYKAVLIHWGLWPSYAIKTPVINPKNAG
jgi:polar amino acid transport system substrate-binding protein